MRLVLEIWPAEVAAASATFTQSVMSNRLFTGIGITVSRLHGATTIYRVVRPYSNSNIVTILAVCSSEYRNGDNGIHIIPVVVCDG